MHNSRVRASSPSSITVRKNYQRKRAPQLATLLGSEWFSHLPGVLLFFLEGTFPLFLSSSMAIVEDDGNTAPAAGANPGGGSRVGIVTHLISGFTPSLNPLDTVQQMQEQMAAMKAQIEALTKKQPTASASRSGASRRRRKVAAQTTQLTNHTQRSSAKDRLGQSFVVTDASGRVHHSDGRSFYFKLPVYDGRSRSRASRRNDERDDVNREKAPVQYDTDGREVIRSRSTNHNGRREGCHQERDDFHQEREDRAPSKKTHHRDRSPRRHRDHETQRIPEYDMDDTDDYIIVRDPHTGESKRYQAETDPPQVQNSGKRKEYTAELGASDERHRLNAKRAYSTGKAYEAPRSSEKPVDSRLQKIQDSPFVQEIREAHPPRNFTVPKFTKHDAKSDAVMHLVHYQQLMGLYGYDEAMMCKAFPVSLQGLGLVWFNQLQPNSISSFEQLEEAFTARFVTNST